MQWTKLILAVRGISLSAESDQPTRLDCASVWTLDPSGYWFYFIKSATLFSLYLLHFFIDKDRLGYMVDEQINAYRAIYVIS